MEEYKMSILDSIRNFQLTNAVRDGFSNVKHNKHNPLKANRQYKVLSSMSIEAEPNTKRYGNKVTKKGKVVDHTRLKDIMRKVVND